MKHCCGARRLREHSTPGTVRAQHRKVEASTGLEARLSEHGKGSPGVPQGKWLLAGPRRGAGAACGAEGRCAVPGRARRGRQVLARPLLLARPSAQAMPLPERPSLAPAAPSPRLGPPAGGLGRPLPAGLREVIGADRGCGTRARPAPAPGTGGAGAGAGPSAPRLRLQRSEAAPAGGSAAPSPGSRRGARARQP